MRQSVVGIIRKDNRFLLGLRTPGGDVGEHWEFPGGKLEAGESPEAALRREIQEELATHVEVGERLCTVTHDYPNFHLTMHCYLCRVVAGNLSLLEHKASRWLNLLELEDVQWLPADVEVVKLLKEML